MFAQLSRQASPYAECVKLGQTVAALGGTLSMEDGFIVGWVWLMVFWVGLESRVRGRLGTGLA